MLLILSLNIIIFQILLKSCVKMDIELNPTSIHTPATWHTGFHIIKLLGRSKYSVFLINDLQTKESFALKLFPFENGRPCQSFYREARFTTLSHPNIVSMVGTQVKQKSAGHGKKFYASYIIMELCPYGDFADLISKTDILNVNERLLRTYFHQFIEGIDYLHSKGIAHLDLKLENLLLGKEFVLKITDFDCAYQACDGPVTKRGTLNYRAPEIREGNCEEPLAADIYSAGIVLFCLKTGRYPFDEITKKDDLESFLQNEDPRFWSIHENATETKFHFSQDFKRLFLSMVRKDPVERATINEIKESKWFRGPVYTPAELKQVMSNLELF